LGTMDRVGTSGRGGGWGSGRKNRRLAGEKKKKSFASCVEPGSIHALGPPRGVDTHRFRFYVLFTRRTMRASLLLFALLALAALTLAADGA
jgi:hypothetical protein